MRLGEECPYITPCGWCSRQEKPCEKKQRYRVDLPAVDLTAATEAYKAMGERVKAEAEQMKDSDMAAAALIQASQNFIKLDTEQETDTLSSAKGYCAASRSIIKH